MEFFLDGRSGVAPYLQIVRQVRRALRLGLVHRGDQLPTVKEVVARLAINPNTVLRAYRELEHDGIVRARPGIGTFVIASFTGAGMEAHASLKASLVQWLEEARAAGVDDESIEALFDDAFRDVSGRVVA